MTNLSGKRALVTGSTSGIGKGVAAELAKAGCSIMLNGFGEAEEIAAQIGELSELHGVTVCHHGADMARPAEIETCITETVEAFGGIDILINNAGVQVVSPLEDFPPEEWDRVIAINLSHAFHTTRLALPHMRKSGWGRIVNMSSAHGLVGNLHRAAYISAKHGLMGLTKVTALETAIENITCNAICPGMVKTPMVDRLVENYGSEHGLEYDRAAQAIMAVKQPSLSLVMPEDVGVLAVFLCSDAAAQITGAALPIDGGWTVQ